MNRVPPAEPSCEQSVQNRGGWLPARPDAEADAVAPKHVRGGLRFRYRLLDLAGREVGLIDREQALTCDDVVIVSSQLGDAAWRVVGVIGTCGTVTPLNG
jgi:hypothetical protein